MIKYNLLCKNKHEFESWFANSQEYERLKKKNLLECIYCNSKEVGKSIMAPRILNSRNQLKIKHNNLDFKKFKKDLKNLRKFIEKNFEFVEKNFASKAREAYYDDKSKKNIYGTTTEDERKELKEEGIDLISIPWIEKEN
tara:strand:- start:1146 stop:1565 length:420 start_codon:yes stop_codon:yes gene_type:complete